MKCYFNSLGLLLFLVLSAPSLVAAQAKSWQMPVDASFAGCYEGDAQAALMDDGTLLLACSSNVTELYRNAPLWQRSAAGIWSMAAQPPTQTSKVSSLRKLSGSVAIVTWLDQSLQEGGLPPNRIQVWTSGQALAPAFQIPAPPDQPKLRPLWDSWGQDERVIRIRNSKVGEFPPPPGSGSDASLISVVELVDRTGQVTGASLPLVGRKVRDNSGSACTLPNGDRLVALLSTEVKTTISPNQRSEIQTAILRKSGVWEGPVTLYDDSSQMFGSLRALCLANGVARVLMAFGQPPASSYADLAGNDGWRPRQSLPVNGFPSKGSTLDSVLHARSPDGQAIVAWNFPQLPVDTLTDLPGHKSIPAVDWLRAGEKYLNADFSIPIYNPDKSEDAAVRAVAWDPKRQRFVFVLIGGAGPTPRRMSADFIPGGSWSAPTPLPSQMLSNWQLDFNASGNGVLLAKRHGRLLISDWR